MTATAPRTRARRRPGAGLPDRWRIAPSVRWSDIVGHERQVRRLRELAALLRLAPEERDRLRLRTGAGLVLAGLPGTGKTLLARAFATDLGRDVFAPEPGELDAATIATLYAELAGISSVVILDEASRLLAPDEWDEDAKAPHLALLAALDGVGRPDQGPVTIALTTDHQAKLPTAVRRPGRLSPVLVLELPSLEDRTELLRRAVAGLPGAEALDLAAIASRTAGWSGAAVVGLAPEAITRSLLDRAPLLDASVVQAIVAERYVLTDEPDEITVDRELLAWHEAGHAVMAVTLLGPGAVEAIVLGERSGSTTLAAHVTGAHRDATWHRKQAAIALAGPAAERLRFGRDGMTTGGDHDRELATALLVTARRLTRPIDEAGLHGMPDYGPSDLLKADREVEVAQAAHDLFAEVLRTLEDSSEALARVAEALMAKSDRGLSGRVAESLVHGVDVA